MTAMFLALAPMGGLALVPMTSTPVQAQTAISVSVFYDRLGEHGRWVEHPRWGWVWYPTDVDQDWRPYTRGHWVWTQEYGWFWQSEEPYGWAVYHYGRWGYDDQYGWVWVPGERWAASWVAFRYSDRAIGWAPLPPETLQVSGTLHVEETILTADYYQPRWVFVPPREFVSVNIFTHIAPPERNVTFIRETRNVTNITIQNNVFVNRSLEPERVRTLVGRDIPTVRVQQVRDPREIRTGSGDTNVVSVFNAPVRIDRSAQPKEEIRAKESDRPRATVKPELVKPEDRRGGTDRDRARPGAPPSDRDRATPGAPPSDRTQPSERDRTTPGAPPSDRDRATPSERDRTKPGAPTDRTQPGERGPQGQPPRGEQERRDRTTPGAPPSGTQPGQKPEDKRGVAPEDKRGTPPGRQGMQPGERGPQGQPPRGEQERRDRTAPGAPPSGTQPGQKPEDKRGVMPDDKRGATPDDKRGTPPGRQGMQPNERGPQGQPPRGEQERRDRATPGAPPSGTRPGQTPSQSDEKRGATPATPAHPPSDRGATTPPQNVAPGAPPSRGPQGQPPGGPKRDQVPGRKAAPGQDNDKKEGPAR